MDASALIFLSSGLFLGWSLGANDASNVFGTAVGSRMIRFATAAVLCSVFVLAGAVVSGAGAAHGLGELGAVNVLPGAFTVALAAAVTVYLMTKAGLPVSTTQAIVGAIVGWNLFSGSVTDLTVLGKIASTWIAAPLLGAMAAAGLYAATRLVVRASRPHLLRLDRFTRRGLILAGVMGSYSLGANNIGNVMGVFLPSSPFTDFQLGGALTVTSTQQLFFLGALAIGVGVFSYSKRVMLTVGTGILPLSPVGAFVSVVAHSLVLFLFSSVALQHLLLTRGLPAIPLVPVSSSQAIVGAVIGIALLRGAKGLRQVRWGRVGGIAVGWVATPVVAGVLCFFSLFGMQNVFNQRVYADIDYALSEATLERLAAAGVPTSPLEPLLDREIASAVTFLYHVEKYVELTEVQRAAVLAAAEIVQLEIDPERLASLDQQYLGARRTAALRSLQGRRFERCFLLEEALERASETWRPKQATPVNELYNKARREQLRYVFDHFRTGVEPAETVPGPAGRRR